MSRGCVGPTDAPADGGVPEASFVPVLDEAGAERWADVFLVENVIAIFGKIAVIRGYESGGVNFRQKTAYEIAW